MRKIRSYRSYSSYSSYSSNNDYPRYDENSDDGYDAMKDNYLTYGGYGYNDRTRQEDKDWNDECRQNGW